jgi:AbrB family looped-hinge helix DNA binding protein
MTVKIPVRKRGQLTLPSKLRKACHIDEGDIVEAEVTEEGILIRPKKLIDSAQAWFWSAEWQRGERVAEEDIKKGRTKTYKSIDEMLKGLKR